MLKVLHGTINAKKKKKTNFILRVYVTFPLHKNVLYSEVLYKKNKKRFFRLLKCSSPEADSTFTWVLYLSTLFEYLYFTWEYFFLETYDFNFTTFERQILYFSLHYISIMVFEVESREKLWKSVGDFFSSLQRDFLFFRQFISNHSCRATWSDFPAFFEHWAVANVIFIYNNWKIRS